MRVARLIAKVPPARGGKEIHGAELSRALAALGIRQTVFARTGDPIGSDVELEVMGGPFTADRRRDLLAYSAWAAARIVRSHRRTPFDVIHAHGDFVEAAAAAAAGAICRVPVMLTIHARPPRWCASGRTRGAAPGRAMAPARGRHGWSA